jgi:hypothetical protein
MEIVMIATYRVICVNIFPFPRKNR